MLPEAQNLRLLYLPNEHTPGDQVGPRHAFEQLHKSGYLAGYEAVSYLCDSTTHTHDHVLTKIVSTVSRMRPNLILWQHLNRFVVPKEVVREIRRIVPDVVIAYHEGDLYGRWIKRLPPNVLEFASLCDLTFLVGMGEFAERFRRAGCPKVVYSPHSVDTVRFGKPWVPTWDREFDVIMIANYAKSRIPFRALPGHHERERLVRRLSAMLGKRFALFGHGWEKYGASMGVLPFHLQEETLRRSWLSVGMDSFPQTPYYFSDRLPIALMSGVAYVSSCQPGLREMFRDGHDIVLFDSVDEAMEKIEDLLRGPKERLVEIGENGRRLAIAKHTSETRMKEMLATMVSLLLQGKQPASRNR